MRGRDQPYFTGERFVRRRVGLQLLARTADSDESPRAARVPLAALFLSNPEPLPLHLQSHLLRA